MSKLKRNQKRPQLFGAFINALPSKEQTAAEHKAADARCGRAWECCCASCRQVRTDPLMLCDSPLMQDTKHTAKFNVGDCVDMINDAGLRFPGKTIVGVKLNPVRGFTYYITPTDTPWFAVKESHLRLA